MQNEIMVSINCITYNHEKYIKEALESFLMQKTDFLYEILIHDDASTDKTAEIINEYQIKYPEIIKPILQTENQYSQGDKRVDYKFNHTRAKGKYIAFCEGDDYWTDPNKLQKQYDYMESNPDCTLCMHAVKKVRADSGKKIGVIRPKKKSAKCEIEEVIIGGGEFVGTNSLFFPKKILDNPPEWYFNAPVGDYAMQMYITSKGYAYYMDQFMSSYRVGVDNSWTTLNSNSIIELSKHLDEVAIMLDEINQISKYKYNDAIELTKKRNEFIVLLKEKKYKEAKSGDLKEVYLALNISAKVKLFIKQFCPGIAAVLINIKRLLLK